MERDRNIQDEIYKLEKYMADTYKSEQFIIFLGIAVGLTVLVLGWIYINVILAWFAMALTIGPFLYWSDKQAKINGEVRSNYQQEINRLVDLQS